MKKLLIVICLITFLLSALTGTALALQGRRTLEASTEDALSHLPYSWTTAITSKTKVSGVYANIQYMDATRYYINVYLDSNKGATYDMLLSTQYLGGVRAGVITYAWEPIDLVIEKADEIRFVISSDSNAPPLTYPLSPSATPFSALIKGTRQ